MNDRKEYAYVLCVNGKITQLVVKEWSTEEEMKIQSSAMWAAARLFKKTAAILVYEHKDMENEIWKIACSFQWSSWYFPQEITITADNKIHYD